MIYSDKGHMHKLLTETVYAVFHSYVTPCFELENSCKETS